MQTPGFFAVLLTLGTIGQATGMKGDAMMVTNNPPGATYVAMFAGDGMTSVKGNVTAMSGMGSKGITFNVMLMGLPTMGGPFSEFFLSPSHQSEIFCH